MRRSAKGGGRVSKEQKDKPVPTKRGNEGDEADKRDKEEEGDDGDEDEGGYRGEGGNLAREGKG